MRQIKFRYWDSYHKEMHYPVCAYAQDCEIIGNICENPKLLEEME
jgi:hypothetical protein